MDLIDRQAAIDAVHEEFDECLVWDESGRHTADEVEQILDKLPAVQPQRKTDEWCTDCKEYDQEKHCCPRFNRVIRQTLSEQRKTGKWTDDNACPFCGFQPWYERDIHTLSFCPNCGSYNGG